MQNSENSSIVTSLLIKYSGGLISDEDQAKNLVFIIMMLTLVFFMYALFFGNRDKIDEKYIYDPSKDTVDDVQQARNLQ